HGIAPSYRKAVKKKPKSNKTRVFQSGSPSRAGRRAKPPKMGKRGKWARAAMIKAQPAIVKYRKLPEYSGSSEHSDEHSGSGSGYSRECSGSGSGYSEESSAYSG